jgi:hypothetical protein
LLPRLLQLLEQRLQGGTFLGQNALHLRPLSVAEVQVVGKEIHLVPAPAKSVAVRRRSGWRVSSVRTGNHRDEQHTKGRNQQTKADRFHMSDSSDWFLPGNRLDTLMETRLLGKRGKESVNGSKVLSKLNLPSQLVSL